MISDITHGSCYTCFQLTDLCVLLPRHLFGQLNTPQNMFLHMLGVSRLKACYIDSVKWRKCESGRKDMEKNLWVKVVPANRSERFQNSLSRRCVNCGCQSQHHKLTKTCGVYLGGGQITETCKHLTSKP